MITHRALDKSTAIRKSRAWTQPDARSRSKNLMLKMVENRISLGKDTSCYFVFRGLRMLPEANCRRSRGQPSPSHVDEAADGVEASCSCSSEQCFHGFLAPRKRKARVPFSRRDSVQVAPQKRSRRSRAGGGGQDESARRHETERRCTRPSLSAQSKGSSLPRSPVRSMRVSGVESHQEGDHLEPGDRQPVQPVPHSSSLPDPNRPCRLTPYVSPSREDLTISVYRIARHKRMFQICARTAVWVKLGRSGAFVRRSEPAQAAPLSLSESRWKMDEGKKADSSGLDQPQSEQRDPGARDRRCADQDGTRQQPQPEHRLESTLRFSRFARAPCRELPKAAVPLNRDVSKPI